MTLLAPDYQTAERMALKRRAIPLPDFAGKRVLDCGCDMGHWSFLAAQNGALSVLGLDRNRDVRGVGMVDLVALCRREAKFRGLSSQCGFTQIELGRQWWEVGFAPFDIVFCFSMYHHWYEACGDHAPIWFWLHRHMVSDGVLLFEGPTDTSDPVVARNVSEANRENYTVASIIGAAERYFTSEYIGPALHEPTREVWRLQPKSIERKTYRGKVLRGAGGATKAFEYAGSRRIGEIADILGVRPVPGSLNVRLTEPFDWDRGYYRSRMLDVVDRSRGLDSPWAMRWARFYPVDIADEDVVTPWRTINAYAFRFEGDSYPLEFAELIAPIQLRDQLACGCGDVFLWS